MRVIASVCDNDMVVFLALSAGHELRLEWVYETEGWGARMIFPDVLARPIESQLNADYRIEDALLAEADHVAPIMPDTAGSHHLIGARELTKIKRTATLVNIARVGDPPTPNNRNVPGAVRTC